MSFDQIMNYVHLAARDALTDFTNNTKTWLIAYFCITMLALGLDLTSFFTQVLNFGHVQSAFADLALVIIAAIFIYID